MKSFIGRMSRTKKIVLILLILVLGWGAYRIWFKKSAPAYQLATAVRGTIVQQVSVTGNTAPAESLNLAFENGGTIAAVNVRVGSHVGTGGMIARLNTSDLEAQLAEAEANVDAATAKLRSLQAGARPADIQASQAAFDKGKQDLANMYASVSNTLSNAYAEANDAVRNQLSAFFSAAETTNPQLTFSVNDSQVLNDVQFKRLQASQELNTWGVELNAVSPASPPSTQEGALQRGAAHLAMVQSLLTSASQAVVQSVNLSPAAQNTYKTSVTAAFSEVTTGATNINSATQNIASQKIAVEQLKAQLDLKVAGATAEDIAEQQANVEQVQASARAIQVKIAKASLRSPIDGIVTVMDAKIGQIASPGVVLVSIISDSALEIDANIPEADIGKVAVGNRASMTLDAFPGQAFSGKVAYIDPGEKVIEGVPTYKTKFMFNNLRPEAKPGMTANIDIVADKHDNVTYIPQRAVLNQSGARTVKVYRGANQPPETRAVTVGLRDVNGNIEIVSGLKEGEVVVSSPQ